MPSSETCKHCRGTGQPNGIMGGPQHGLCSYCGGSGLAHPAPTAADTPGHSEELRKSLQSVADELSKRPPELRGPFKMPSRAAADTGLVERLTAERDEWMLLFDECAMARDASGFIGTVPQCIEHWEACATTSEQQLAAAHEQIAELERPNSTQREEWLAAQAALDRNSVLLLEKQLSSAHETIRGSQTVLAAVRPIIFSLIQAGFNVDTWGLNRVLEDIDAALTLAAKQEPRHD